MKVNMSVKPGAYSAEGEAIDPAAITLVLSDLQLPEYRTVVGILVREFHVDTSSSVFRHNRDVIMKGADSIHDGSNPHEGNRAVT
jgi:hypothetical protein